MVPRVLLGKVIMLYICSTQEAIGLKATTGIVIVLLKIFKIEVKGTETLLKN